MNLYYIFIYLNSLIKLINKKGINHLDIKPQNILETINNKFVLTDFGTVH